MRYVETTSVCPRVCDPVPADFIPPHPGHQQAASSVLYTTSCKHSLLLLRMGEIIARSILS